MLKLANFMSLVTAALCTVAWNRAMEIELSTDSDWFWLATKHQDRYRDTYNPENELSTGFAK